MADEPVVVSKTRPMKASNGVEGKTKPTINIVFDRVNCKRELKALAGWIRRRLRAIQLRLWEHPQFKFIKMNSWLNSLSPLSCVGMANQWFKELYLYSIEKVNTGWITLSAFRKTR